MFLTTIVEAVTVLVTLIIQFAVSDWLLEIKLGSYSNPSSTNENGQCCDSTATANCSQHAKCDNIFCFLLQPYGAGYLPPGTVSCLYYIEWSSETDDIQFGSNIYTQGSYVENPLTVEDFGSYPQYQLVVVVQDKNTICYLLWNYCYSTLDPVDEIYVNCAVYPSSNFTALDTTIGRYQRGTITLSFRLTCSLNWYGNDCGTFCKPESNSNFKCDNDGNMVCMNGWSGINCSSAICSDGCATSSQAYCNVPDQCICLPGWSGAQCTHCISRENCSSIGGYCLQPYQCLCHENYTGENCDTIVDPGIWPPATQINVIIGAVFAAVALLAAALVVSIIAYTKLCKVHRVMIITNSYVINEVGDKTNIDAKNEDPDKSNTYTKNEDPDKSNTYTKNEDPDKSNTYTKNEVPYKSTYV